MIAIIHRRFDVAADMIAKVPRKQCHGGGLPERTLQESAIVIKAVDIHARAYGAEALRRAMIHDYFDQLAASADAGKQRSWTPWPGSHWIAA